LNRDSPNS